MGTTSWVVPGPQSLDLEQVGAVRLQLIGGRAEVVVGDGPGTHVEVRAVTGHPLEVRLEQGRLSIGYPFLGWDGWLKRLHSYRAKDTAEVRVVLPRGVGLKVGTVLADVEVQGVQEDVSVGTASGAVHVSGCRGTVDVKAVSGAVVITDHDGAVRVNTVSGSLSVSGSLPRMEATTVSGAVGVDNRLATSVMSVSAVSAAIGIALPADSGLVLTARSVSGRLVVDGVDRRTPAVTSVEDRKDEGGCWLSVNTVSGNVDIRRGDTPVAVPVDVSD